MSDFKLNTTVALIIFKRPETTARVFEAIRQAKPPKLFVIADGARSNIAGEAEKCAATRAIIDRVDWDCKVYKNYAEKNLGCGLRPATGISWVFENVEEAIVLEDDCIPHVTFFRFAEELLKKYQHDQRIMTISALSVPYPDKSSEYSYHFSRYPRTWGWATWKRAWQNFDYKLQLWAEINQSNVLNNILETSQMVKHWSEVFQSVYDGKINTVWDYQWLFACWIQNGLSIIPNTNLVSNIGIGKEATHTKKLSKERAELSLESMDFPLKHPPFITRDLQADLWIQKNIHSISTSRKIKTKAKQLLGIKK